jgi:hypothetical protein
MLFNIIVRFWFVVTSNGWSASLEIGEQLELERSVRYATMGAEARAIKKVTSSLLANPIREIYGLASAF